MASNKKMLDDKLREVYLEMLSAILTEKGEEVLRTNSNEICLPCVDEENNDKFIVITVKVPTGSRDGDLYDGYEMAEDYKMKLKNKAEKAEERAKEKAKKMARDKKQREQAAAIHAKKEMAKGE